MASSSNNVYSGGDEAFELGFELDCMVSDTLAQKSGFGSESNAARALAILSAPAASQNADGNEFDDMLDELGVSDPPLESSPTKLNCTTTGVYNPTGKSLYANAGSSCPSSGTNSSPSRFYSAADTQEPGCTEFGASSAFPAADPSATLPAHFLSNDEELEQARLEAAEEAWDQIDATQDQTAAEKSQVQSKLGNTVRISKYEAANFLKTLQFKILLDTSVRLDIMDFEVQVSSRARHLLLELYHQPINFNHPPAPDTPEGAFEVLAYSLQDALQASKIKIRAAKMNVAEPAAAKLAGRLGVDASSEVKGGRPVCLWFASDMQDILAPERYNGIYTADALLSFVNEKSEQSCKLRVPVIDLLEKITVEAPNPNVGCCACLGSAVLQPRLHEEREEVFLIAQVHFDDAMNRVKHYGTLPSPPYIERTCERILQTIYMSLTGVKVPPARYGEHWQDIGFQGNDPATDFRGIGMLGIYLILSFISDHIQVCKSIYKLSLHPQQEFPFCVTSFMCSQWAIEALRQGFLAAECNARGEVLSVVQDYYYYSFWRLATVWQERHCTIGKDSGFVFKEMHEEAKKNALRNCRNANSMSVQGHTDGVTAFTSLEEEKPIEF